MASEGERAKALLTYANYAKVAAALQVSRVSVAEWAKGKSVTPYRLRQLEQLLRPDLQVAKEPQPEWAGAMEARLTDAIRDAGLTSAERAALRSIDATATPTGANGDDPAEEGVPVRAHG